MDKKRIKEVMAGPADIENLWKLLSESNAETMQIKLFRNEGDEKPFRLMALVEGEKAVAEVMKFLDERGS